VLTQIDRYPIANDGNVHFEDNAVLFAELLERRQWGDTVDFEVWRNGAPKHITVPLTNPTDPFIYRNEYDRRPRYAMVGGLVFAPLSRNLLQTIERRVSGPNELQLFYYARYAKPDGLFADREEFVVLIRRLPHRVNTYAEGFENGILKEWNGRPIRRLADVIEAATSPDGGFHVLRFEGMPQSLVLDAAACAQATDEIRCEYGVPSDSYLGENHAAQP